MDTFKIPGEFYDKEFRKKLIENPSLAGDILEYEDRSNITFVVKINTKSTTYIPIPYYSDKMQSDDIAKIQAAGHTAGSAGTALSASTAGTLSSCLSSASSVGSASTVGSAKT